MPTCDMRPCPRRAARPSCTSGSGTSGRIGWIATDRCGRWCCSTGWRKDAGCSRPRRTTVSSMASARSTSGTPCSRPRRRRSLAPPAAAEQQHGDRGAQRWPSLAVARTGDARCAGRRGCGAASARIARARARRRRADRARGADRSTEVELERADERHTPLRDRAPGPRRGQGDQDAHGRHGQRRRARPVRGRPAATAARSG